MVAALKIPGSRIVASASQDPYGMAREATAPAIGVMGGKAPPQPVKLLDTRLVSRDNAATFKGWDAARD